MGNFLLTRSFSEISVTVLSNVNLLLCKLHVKYIPAQPLSQPQISILPKQKDSALFFIVALSFLQINISDV